MMLILIVAIVTALITKSFLTFIAMVIIGCIIESFTPSKPKVIINIIQDKGDK